MKDNKDLGMHSGQLALKDLTFDITLEKKKNKPVPGIELGSTAWKAAILTS